MALCRLRDNSNGPCWAGQTVGVSRKVLVNYGIIVQEMFLFDGGQKFGKSHGSGKICEGTNGTLHRLSWSLRSSTKTGSFLSVKHRHLVETGLAMLFHAHVPASYWVDAFSYKCLDPDSSRIYITRHARFDEVTFPFASTANPNALSTLQLCTFLEDGPPISDAPVPESRPPPIQGPSSSSPVVSPPATAPTEPSSVHQMKTRSKSGIFKTKHSPDFVSLTSHALHAALFSLVQPKGFKSAAKHPQWMAAMHDEMEALKQNCTWTLVPRPSASNIVGSKWVYRIKYHADGSVERFKARVVAQGFTQIPGLDYSHTFSPVVKASTVRIVLSLAVLHRWRLHQLDVKNAFLHGHLNETVYMEQPPGFIDPQFPNHVCKLSKALYGLKQAPRAWFHRLSSFLLAHGFVCSRADTSLFVFTKDSCIMYLLVYVDDLILTGNNESLLTSFTTRLNQEFAIKDLGDLSYFLGLEVSYTNDGLFLSQAKYATDVLTRAALLDSKPVSTPLAANEVFVTGGSLFANPTLYRSLVGALQYLTITRPDLSYAVNQASQFLHAPTDAHFQSVKRILRYVKGTITYGLIFRRPHSNSILGYSDADWARCIETRRSTYGYSIFLGGNLVSWSAKKQPTVSRSSCESEYRAMANTAAEIIWITHLLRELHALPPDRPTLLCDNKSALFMSQNPVSHKRAKHIDLDYHFVRELVASGKLYTKFIPTKLQVADIFTKSLPRPQFESKNETRVDESEVYTLDGIRSSLIRQEDIIIFSLLERAQYCYNEDTYDPNAFVMDGFQGSLVEFMVKETEKVYAQVGRYKSPDEHPFFPNNLPDPLLPPLEYPQVLHPCTHEININYKIWDIYFKHLLPRLVKEGNDAKFRASPADYEATIKAQDRQKLMYLLTYPAVEDAIKKRVETKTKTFGQVVTVGFGEDTTEPVYKIKPSLVANLYREWIMPLTNEVQAEYLLRRLG
ncbi:retrovirus-related pol polyprotein from transposon RE1 [Tanacetum coccineum]